MEHLFANQPCEIIVDDILVYGKDAEEHDANLKQVFNRVRQLNMKLNAEKCKFHVKFHLLDIYSLLMELNVINQKYLRSQL